MSVHRWALVPSQRPRGSRWSWGVVGPGPAPGGPRVEVMPVADYERQVRLAQEAEAVIRRLADWIEQNCEGVQVNRDTGLVIS